MRVLNARLLALVVVLGGCYEPSVDSCKLYCASGECPEGLFCNAKKLCAYRDDLCDQVEPVTVTVHNSLGLPSAGATVIFANPDGELIEETASDMQGNAVATVPEGSSATVIHVQAGVEAISTFIGLRRGAHVVSTAVATTSTLSPLDIQWTTVVNATSYDIAASCTTGGVQRPTDDYTFDVQRRCATVHAAVIANGADLGAIKTANLSTAGVTLDNFGPLRSVDYTVTGLPTNVFAPPNARLGMWINTALPDAIAFANHPDVTNPTPPFRVPASAGASITFGFFPQDATDTSRLQFVVYRVPATVPRIDPDFTDALLPWMSAIGVALDVPAVRWTALDPDSGVRAPDLVVALLTYQRGGTTYHWRIVAPGSSITATDASRELRFPDVPGMRAFEPDANDLPRGAALTLISANTGVDQLYGIVEGAASDLSVFGIAGLDRLNVSLGAVAF